MSKFTSGPWRVNGMGAIFGPDGNPIMTCGKHAVQFGEGTEEALANAHLIAASVDLLVENKRLREMMHNLYENKLEPDKLYIQIPNYHKEMLEMTATAKAEGGV